mgnify:CR=1 FL=1
MLRSRLSPCLLINDGALVKSINFSNYKYVGDPLNAVRIFNELYVDEIIILDISASRNNKQPDFDLISNISSQCRMPLCYGGGIKDLDTIQKLISLGIEKVAIGKSSFDNPKLIEKASKLVGSQSIVCCLDIARSRFSKRLSCRYLNGKKDSRKHPILAANELINLGAGEIIFQSIENDGKKCGYDQYLIRSLVENINYPVTILGGASSYENIREISDNFGPIGISAGSIFVFQGIHSAVLINYPDSNEKKRLTTAKNQK